MVDDGKQVLIGSQVIIGLTQIESREKPFGRYFPVTDL
jgi:hypothetical protein